MAVNYYKKITGREKGFIIMEVFIALAVISIAFALLVDVGRLAVKASTSLQTKSQADFLAKEELETVRNFRDGSTWASGGIGGLATGNPNSYYASKDTTVNPNAWKMVAGSEVAGIFTRKVVVDKVSRDPANSNIENIYNAGHNDPDTRKITVSVSWSGQTLTIITYLTNWK